MVDPWLRDDVRLLDALVERTLALAPAGEAPLRRPEDVILPGALRTAIEDRAARIVDVSGTMNCIVIDPVSAVTRADR